MSQRDITLRSVGSTATSKAVQVTLRDPLSPTTDIALYDVPSPAADGPTVIVLSQLERPAVADPTVIYLCPVAAAPVQSYNVTITLDDVTDGDIVLRPMALPAIGQYTLTICEHTAGPVARSLTLTASEALDVAAMTLTVGGSGASLTLAMAGTEPLDVAAMALKRGHPLALAATEAVDTAAFALSVAANESLAIAANESPDVAAFALDGGGFVPALGPMGFDNWPEEERKKRERVELRTMLDAAFADPAPEVETVRTEYQRVPESTSEQPWIDWSGLLKSTEDCLRILRAYRGQPVKKHADETITVEIESLMRDDAKRRRRRKALALLL